MCDCCDKVLDDREAVYRGFVDGLWHSICYTCARKYKWEYLECDGRVIIDGDEPVYWESS